MSEQLRTEKDANSGQDVAKHPGRYHVDHWKDRLYRKSYTRGGKRFEVQEWSVRLQHAGKREAFALGTTNATVGAAKAKEIAVFLEANGWAPTLAKFKPGPARIAGIATVGAFLTDVAKRSHLKAITVRRYGVKLRKMASDIAGLESGLKQKERRKKYDYATGGRVAWLAKVDALRLDVLTPDSVAAWRNRYVGKAGSDPRKRKSAERSAASYMRCVRALFAGDVLARLKVLMPPNPFAGVKIKDPGPQRYHSSVDPEWLLACADRELLGFEGDEYEKAKRRQQYIALFLCLWAGVRRKEADLLLWEQVDLADGQIQIRRTYCFEPKSDEGERTIDLAPDAVAVLRRFKEGATQEFVLDGADPHPEATYDYYRCDCTWRFLNAWLRSKGVRDLKAVHSMRKESGSLVASTHGIEAARQHLGHRDIRTTSAHYVTKKKRIEVGLPVRPGLAVAN